MRDRYLDTSLHVAWCDDEERVVTFPLWNLSGQMVGYQAYRPDAEKVQKNDQKGRYYTYRGHKHYPKHSKTVAVWGLESWNLSTTLFVTEGIFDAARASFLGKSCVALLSNHPNSSLRQWIRIVSSTRPIVLVLDDGESGGWASSLSNIEIIKPPFKDLGEATDEYVKELCDAYV